MKQMITKEKGTVVNAHFTDRKVETGSSHHAGVPLSSFSTFWKVTCRVLSVMSGFSHISLVCGYGACGKKAEKKDHRCQKTHFQETAFLIKNF